MKPTVIKGEVMAANMLEQATQKGFRVAKVTCDERIPITPTGAVFRCSYHGSDGSSERYEYKMDRAGALSASLLDSTKATIERPAPAPGTDIWGD